MNRLVYLGTLIVGNVLYTSLVVTTVALIVIYLCHIYFFKKKRSLDSISPINNVSLSQNDNEEIILVDFDVNGLSERENNCTSVDCDREEESYEDCKSTLFTDGPPSGSNFESGDSLSRTLNNRLGNFYWSASVSNDGESNTNSSCSRSDEGCIDGEDGIVQESINVASSMLSYDSATSTDSGNRHQSLGNV